MIGEYLKLSTKYIRYRKLRAWLTIIGIIIGVAAIVSLFLLGEGMQNAITEQFSNMGSRRILVAPQGLNGPPIGVVGLTQDDVDVLDKLPELDYAAGTLWLPTKVGYNKKEDILNVQAVNPEKAKKLLEDVDTGLEAGRFLEKGDKFNAFIGYRLAEDYFDKGIYLKSSIYINDQKFRVVGIQEEAGDPDTDTAIYIPLEAARIIWEKEDEISAIMAQVKDGVSIERAKDKIFRTLEKKRGEEDFVLFTPEEIQEQINSVLGVVQTVVVGIAIISLIVGAIGIMNAMYTAVLERTREIGTMKAIGATNQSILTMFLIESGLIGLIGGILGVLLGIGMAKLVEIAAMQAGFNLLKIVVRPEIIIIGLTFSFIVGVISGVWPAKKATELKPIEALRYE